MQSCSGSHCRAYKLTRRLTVALAAKKAESPADLGRLKALHDKLKKRQKDDLADDPQFDELATTYEKGRDSWLARAQRREQLGQVVRTKGSYYNICIGCLHDMRHFLKVMVALRGHGTTFWPHPNDQHVVRNIASESSRSGLGSAGSVSSPSNDRPGPHQSSQGVGAWRSVLPRPRRPEAGHQGAAAYVDAVLRRAFRRRRRRLEPLDAAGASTDALKSTDSTSEGSHSLDSGSSTDGSTLPS